MKVLGATEADFKKKSSIYLCSLIVIILIFRINVYIGKRNARTIISAIDAYYENVGDYADKIQDLVPQYLKETPVCAYRFSDHQYRYVYNGTSHFLMWPEVPPFGHRTYHFKNTEWSYRD